jgi:solute carrier family 25 protein 16
MENNPPISSDRKGKSRAVDLSSTPSPVMPLLEEQHPLSRESERWTASKLWRESRKRAQANRNSWDYGQWQ